MEKSRLLTWRDVRNLFMIMVSTSTYAILNLKVSPILLPLVAFKIKPQVVETTLKVWATVSCITLINRRFLGKEHKTSILF